ncbi:MAG: Hsp33 family molecular chaperone HslO [Clostridia bacterium]|nr:Hsp33 family molecular chaperone HslO [Clostridia bacterium]
MRRSTLMRALTQDGSAMIVAADSTQIVQTAHEIHGLSKTMTAALGRALTAASMMGSLLKEEKQSVTLRFCGDGPAGTICCVSDWRGNVRGYADHPEAELPPNAKGKLDVGGAVGRGQMHVLRDLGLDMPYVGVASIVSGEIAEDVTNYFASSEQTPSVCALGVLVHPDFNCRAAGGFLVQLLPYADPTVVETIEANIGKIDSVSRMVDSGMTPQDIIDTVFAGLAYDVLDTAEIDYVCPCSRVRYARALLSLGKEELQRLVNEDEPVETLCSFCGKKYVFGLDEVRAMLEKAK